MERFGLVMRGVILDRNRTESHASCTSVVQGHLFIICVFHAEPVQGRFPMDEVAGFTVHTPFAQFLVVHRTEFVG
jgi:hypothetical protein